MKQNKIEKGKSKKETTARASESWAMGLRYAIKGNTDGTGRFLENEGSSCLLRLFSFFNNVKLPTESSNIQENDLGKLWVDLSRSCSFKSLSIYFDIFATTFCSETIVDPLQGNRRTVDQLIHQILDKIGSVFDHCTWTNRDRSSTALLKHDRSIEFETPIRLLQKFHDSRVSRWVDEIVHGLAERNFSFSSIDRSGCLSFRWYWAKLTENPGSRVHQSIKKDRYNRGIIPLREIQDKRERERKKWCFNTQM